nr:hypothetical protein Iba_chr12bCG19550 [Ipomoea batatas]
MAEGGVRLDIARATSTGIPQKRSHSHVWLVRWSRVEVLFVNMPSEMRILSVQQEAKLLSCWVKTGVRVTFQLRYLSLIGVSFSEHKGGSVVYGLRESRVNGGGL